MAYNSSTQFFSTSSPNSPPDFLQVISDDPLVKLMSAPTCTSYRLREYVEQIVYNCIVKTFGIADRIVVNGLVTLVTDEIGTKYGYSEYCSALYAAARIIKDAWFGIYPPSCQPIGPSTTSAHFGPSTPLASPHDYTLNRPSTTSDHFRPSPCSTPPPPPHHYAPTILPDSTTGYLFGPSTTSAPVRPSTTSDHFRPSPCLTPPPPPHHYAPTVLPYSATGYLSDSNKSFDPEDSCYDSDWSVDTGRVYALADTEITRAKTLAKTLTQTQTKASTVQAARTPATMTMTQTVTQTLAQAAMTLTRGWVPAARTQASTVPAAKAPAPAPVVRVPTQAPVASTVPAAKAAKAPAPAPVVRVPTRVPAPVEMMKTRSQTRTASALAAEETLTLASTAQTAKVAKAQTQTRSLAKIPTRVQAPVPAQAKALAGTKKVAEETQAVELSLSIEEKDLWISMMVDMADDLFWGTELHMVPPRVDPQISQMVSVMFSNVEATIDDWESKPIQTKMREFKDNMRAKAHTIIKWPGNAATGSNHLYYVLTLLALGYTTKAHWAMLSGVDEANTDFSSIIDAYNTKKVYLRPV